MKGLRKTGEEFDIELSLASVLIDNNWHAAGIVRDISDRKNAEKQNKALESELQHAQKMESIGRLAGGVAHDFNNLLTVIKGNLDLTDMLNTADKSLRSSIETIRAAADRAAGLTRQLLIFTRKQVNEPSVVDLNESVLTTIKMLRRLIGENVEIKTDLTTYELFTLIDPGQLEQVIMNLTVNARDAMPEGGTITITTRKQPLTLEEAQLLGFTSAGEYLQLSLADTGTGMSEEIQAKAFDPFFTTKEVGKGTGLGLATVYSIVKQAEGKVRIESKVGFGTTISIYLKLCKKDLEQKDTLSGVVKLPRGNEKILIVEDEVEVKEIISQYLSKQGYKVSIASHGQEAMDIIKSQQIRFDLIITDLVMPEMGGFKLAREIRKQQPSAKIVFMSGYLPDTLSQDEPLEPGVNFIQKPINRMAFTQFVRRSLDN